MVTSSAKTVDEYVASLPADRRAHIERVRAAVNEHMPDGYNEIMTFGMIGWGIPLDVYPDTYNGQPAGIAALASQKNYMSLYLLGAYADRKQRERLEKHYAKLGKRLDMGQSCLRFRSADELPLDLIGELIEGCPPEKLIALMEDARASRKKAPAKKAAAKKSAAKRSAPKKSAPKKSAAKKSAAKKRAR